MLSSNKRINAADKCVELLEQNLPEYGLNLWKDTVGIMTDGTILMENIGRL